MIKITVNDVNWASVSKADAKVLKPAVSYDSEFYRQGRYHKIKQDYRKSLIDQWGKFPAGLIPRIQEYCAERGIDLCVEGMVPTLPVKAFPVVPGFTLRDDQEGLIRAALKHQRGILKSPTASGKTVLGMHLIKAFEGKNVLFLVNAVGLLTKTQKDFRIFQNVGIIGNSIVEPDQITIATVQTLSKMGPTEFLKNIDVLIIDEAHHYGSPSYSTVLSWCHAHVRIGLTATLPEEPETVLKMESFIGPILHEVTINDLKEVGILAKPIIRILKPPLKDSVSDMKKYADVYDAGIVKNRHRNKMVLDIAAEFVEKDQVSLILVTKIEHGNELVRMSEILYPDMDIVFVQGKTDAYAREAVIEAMEAGHHRCVIATAVFKEGINIKSINCMILASGGKSELALLQSVGRGLRTTETKKDVTIVDFCDISHKYLSQHSLERIWVYIDMGWLS